MAYTSYNKLWKNEFDNIVSKRDRLQDLNINQSKLDIHDTYEKDEKYKTNFEPTDSLDFEDKSYFDEKLKNIDGYISYIENDYSEFKLQYNKQSVEEVLVQKAVKTTIQKLYDKGLLDAFPIADKVPQIFSFTTRRRLELEEVNDDIQWFCL